MGKAHDAAFGIWFCVIFFTLSVYTLIFHYLKEHRRKYDDETRSDIDPDKDSEITEDTDLKKLVFGTNNENDNKKEEETGETTKKDDEVSVLEVDLMEEENEEEKEYAKSFEKQTNETEHEEGTPPPYQKVFQFIDKSDFLYRTLYHVTMDNDLLRVAQVRSRTLKQVNELKNVSSDATAIGGVKSVPIDMFSNLNIHYKRNISWVKLLYVRLFQLFLLISTLLPYLMGFFAAVIVIAAIYVPLSMDRGQFDEIGAEDGRKATNGLFGNVLFVGIIFFWFLYKNYKFRPSITHSVDLTVLSLVKKLGITFYFIMLILVTILYSISRERSGNDNDESGDSGNNKNDNDDRGDLYRLTCGCGPDDDEDVSRRRLEDNIYEFACDSDDTRDLCHSNCGVCGDSYYGPYVIFSLFAWAFLLCMFVLMFYHHFMKPLIPLVYNPLVSSTCAVVVMHGSRAYGYPVLFKLSVEEAHSLETSLRAISEEKKAKHGAIVAAGGGGGGSGGVAETHLSNLYTIGVLYDLLAVTSSSLMTFTEDLFSFPWFRFFATIIFLWILLAILL